MDWSSKVPDQKRGIPLVFELGLLERRYAKLEVDDDYGEVLLARPRARLGGAKRWNVFLLEYKTKA